MKVEIWSDVVCPWCYVGKRNFEAALDAFAHRAQVEVVWRSFELDPSAPAIREGTYGERLAEKYGVSLGEAQAMIARMVSAAADVGLDFRFDQARPGNTFAAHRLLHLALERGLQDELKERLLRATFTEGRPIAEPETLVALAAEVGIPEADAREVLDSDRFTAEVRADEREAAELGVSGVPFFVVDRRYGVSGAQPPAVLREVLERAWTESRPALVLTGGEDAPGCDGDACDV